MACGLPSKILHDDVELVESKSIGNAFNKFFANIGNNMAKSVPSANTSPHSYMPRRHNKSSYFFSTSSKEIEEEISKLNTSKASGPYSIPTKILKLLQCIISKPLEVIFKFSFSTDIVPYLFKIARVIPVYKKGSQLCVNNYRPISLLFVFNRILEELVFKRLSGFIDKYNLLYCKQFVFRPSYSTIHATLSITDSIQKAFEKGTFSCGIFLDLSKAFDSVNHLILLEKLDHYGVRGLTRSWFTSYLSERKQFVSLGNINSDISNNACGVPQGSVLDPLLFLLYLNDFHNSSKILEFHLFADDANLYCTNNNLQELEVKVNKELIHVQNWLCANKLTLKIEKSNFLIFHIPQKKLTNNIKLCINGKLLKQENYIKYLGIMIDCHLNWKSHINFVTRKVKRSIGILSRVRHFTNISILISFYYTLIYPFLTYGLIAWGNTYHSTINPIFILQKKVCVHTNIL